MNIPNSNALALVIGLVISTGIMAEESLPKNKYESLGKQIDAVYDEDNAACNALIGNFKDICEATAKGKTNIAKAVLEHNYKPTAKTMYNMRVTKADADYSVAAQKCDDKAGNAEDVCVKEAKAARIQQTAAAEAQMKTLKADAVAIEKSNDARKDAETDMRDANYAVAKQKCEALVDNAKDLCIKDAKIHFGM
ncbi:hypothetical protein [Methyloglobulus sp.]|uniref:hypothetical protein n=1 Tax=Methyloglobulus sp. TaxID=2518622 RepID=UPI0032B808CC